MSSVFCELWFTPLPEGPDQKDLLLRRVTNITSVVSTTHAKSSSSISGLECSCVFQVYRGFKMLEARLNVIYDSSSEMSSFIDC